MSGGMRLFCFFSNIKLILLFSVLIMVNYNLPQLKYRYEIRFRLLRII